MPLRFLSLPQNNRSIMRVNKLKLWQMKHAQQYSVFETLRLSQIKTYC